MTTNQIVPMLTAVRTAAGRPTQRSTSGTTKGKAKAPAIGVRATKRRMRGDGMLKANRSEPLSNGLIGWIAVVFGSFPVEFQGDVPLLDAISGDGLDRVQLASIPEGDLNPECAI